MTSTFDIAARSIRPVDDHARAAAVTRSDRLTKPRGSLGRLEALGAQLASIAQCCPPPVPEPVTVCVFAADHGVVAAGVTPWPQEVTAQMVANFCAGGAAVTVLARQIGASVMVTDIGVATPIDVDSPMLHRRPVRRGTANLAAEPAMSVDEMRAALDAGADCAAEEVAGGARMLVTGEMGIGNTTPAAALIAALTRLGADVVTGRGTGIDDETLALKTDIVRTAVGRLPANAAPLQVLAEIGGLEIAGLVGLIIGGAAAGVPVLLDGVIAQSAALVACAAVPDVAGYLIAGHRSAEPGSAAVLRHLRLDPLLDLGMRLGEGSGAVLAVPLVQAAARVLSEMATFDEAEVADA